jgi:hypothetical protein
VARAKSRSEPVSVDCELCGAVLAEPAYYEGYAVCGACKKRHAKKLERMRVEADEEMRG